MKLHAQTSIDSPHRSANFIGICIQSYSFAVYDFMRKRCFYRSKKTHLKGASPRLLEDGTAESEQLKYKFIES